MNSANRLRSVASRLQVIALSMLALSACRVGGKLVTEARPQVAPMQIEVPTVAIPATTPAYSSANRFEISGLCSDKQRIILGGDSIQEAECTDYRYQFLIDRTTDGIYAFSITQVNIVNGKVSAPLMVVWVRKSSVAPPTVLVPATPTVLDGRPALTISGTCEYGATISLQGPVTGSTPCVNSAFSIVAQLDLEGDHSIRVVQSDAAGNSSFKTILWKRYVLRVTPSNFQSTVNSKINIEPSGGSGGYIMSIVNSTEPGSGGELEPASGLPDTEGKIGYRVGRIARRADRLKVTDSSGNFAEVVVNTIPEAPDHLEYFPSSQDDPNAGFLSEVLPGALSPTELGVRVVDVFGNGIDGTVGAGAFVAFAPLVGGGQVIGGGLVKLDAEGRAMRRVRLGNADRFQMFRATSVGPLLPDLALSGRAQFADFRVTANPETRYYGGPDLRYSIGQEFKPPSFGQINSDLTQGGDLNPDMVGVSTADNKLRVFLSRSGDGSMIPPPSTPPAACPQTSARKPVAQALGDFDGDGKADVLIVCSDLFGASGSVLRVQWGDGTGAFLPDSSTFHRTTTQSEVVGIAVADFNGDGVPDVAIASVDGMIWVHLAAGPGAFTGTGIDRFQSSHSFGVGTAYPVGVTLRSIVTTDLDQNGSMDLVASGQVAGTGNNNRIFVLSGAVNGSGQPTGSFGATTAYTVASGANTLSVGRMHEPSGPDDTFPDIVVANPTAKKVHFFMNQGAGGNPSLRGVLSWDPTDDVWAELSFLVTAAVGDFDNDGRDDLVTLESNTTLIQTDGDRKLVQYRALRPEAGSLNFAWSRRPLSSAMHAPVLLSGGGWVATGKLTGGADAPVDVVVPGLNSLSNPQLRILPSNGDGSIGLISRLSAGDAPLAATYADFNVDGFQDLALIRAGATRSAVVAPGVGGGKWRSLASVNLTGLNNPSAVLAADMNKDGRPDLIVVDRGQNAVRVYYAKSPPTPSPSPVPSGSPSPSPLVSPSPSPLVSPSPSPSVSPSPSLTIEFESTFRQVSVGGSPFGAVVGDFNRDGRLDILTRNAGNMTLLYGAADGSFTSKTISVGGGALGPNKIVMGDFNLDGFIDVATLNTSGDLIVLLGLPVGEGNVGTPFQSPMAYAAGDGASEIVSGDFTGDAVADLLVYFRGADQLSVRLFKGKGDGSFEARAPIVLTTTAPLFQMTPMVLNTSGRVDLVFARETDASIPGAGGFTIVPATNMNGSFGAPVDVDTGFQVRALYGGDWAFSGDRPGGGRQGLLMLDDESKIHTWLGR